MSRLFSLTVQQGDFTLDAIISDALGGMTQDLILYLDTQLQLKYMCHVVEIVAAAMVRV